MQTEELGHLKFSKKLTGNRTRNLASCGVVLQTTAALCKKGLTKVL